MKCTKYLFSVLLALASISSFAQWQWIDKDGRRVFSDRAPPPEILDKNIIKRPAGGVSAPLPAPSAPAASQPSADSVAQGAAPSKDAGVDKALEEKKKKAEAEELAKRKEEENKIAKARIENCARAKQAKSTFDSGIRVARTNDKGEREIMDDAARATETKRLQDIIRSDCK